MTEEQLDAETEKRIAINEGRSARVYIDTMGNPTVGVGCNLRSVDPALFEQIGASYAKVLSGEESLTDAQIDQLFALQLAPIVDAARASLATGIYDALAEARKFVVRDLEFNLGQAGWLGFPASRALINEAQGAKNAGDMVKAHMLFGVVADHLRMSAWDGQVHARARRDEAMMRTSSWCDPNGDGSDVAA